MYESGLEAMTSDTDLAEDLQVGGMSTYVFLIFFLLWN